MADSGIRPAVASVTTFRCSAPGCTGATSQPGVCPVCNGKVVPLAESVDLNVHEPRVDVPGRSSTGVSFGKLPGHFERRSYGKAILFGVMAIGGVLTTAQGKPLYLLAAAFFGWLAWNTWPNNG